MKRSLSPSGTAGGRQPIWARALSAFFVFNVMGAFTIVDRLAYGDWDGKQGDKLTQALNLVQIVSSGILFWRAFVKRPMFESGELLLLLLAGFLALSAFWSIEPEVSLRRGILYLLFIVGCIGAAGSMEADEFMETTSLACCACAAASLLLLIVSPGMVLTVENADFRGVFSHKTVLGEVMLAGVVATLHSMRAGRRSGLPGYLMLLLLIVVALLSKSSSALMTSLVVCLGSALVSLSRRGGTARIAAVSLACASMPLLLAGMMFQGAILELLGKDPTLTGRTDLWAYVIGYIWQRPVLGWGLTAFWAPDNPAAIEISSIVGWVVPQAHNGLLEILLETGVVGAALFAMLLVRNVRAAVRCMRTPDREIGASAALCTLSILLVGLTESVLIDPSIAVAMFVVLDLMCQRAARARRRVEPRVPAMTARRALPA